jgi:hypothetical protein
VRLALVAVFTTVIVAFGMIAPAGSVTFPLIEAEPWAKRAEEVTSNRDRQFATWRVMIGRLLNFCIAE